MKRSETSGLLKKPTKLQPKEMRRSVISKEGVIYLVVVGFVFVGAILREINLLLLFASLLVCPLFIAWRLGKVTLEKLVVVRGKPSNVVAGKLFHVPIELINRRARLSSWAIVVEDRIESVHEENAVTYEKSGSKNSKLMRPIAYFEFVRAGGTIKKSYSGVINKRGRYRLGPIMISTRFPVGFFQSWSTLGSDEFAGKSKKSKASHDVAVDDTDAYDEKDIRSKWEKKPKHGSVEFLVYPRLGNISSDWFARKRQSEDEKQKRRRFQASRISGEFLGVRHWQSGDIRKWIHWRASAKHDKLVVRLHEQQQNRSAVVILDMFQPNEPTEFEAENIEKAVSFAASLINKLGRIGGSNIFLGVSNDTNLISGQISIPLIENMMERLATVDPTQNDKLVDLLVHALSVADANADLFLVSHRPIQFTDSSRFKALIGDPRLRMLSQRLIVIDTSSSELNDFFSIS
ncbi:MAG: DUF58 domain-containing protein [Thermoguttaceae bacterium]